MVSKKDSSSADVEISKSEKENFRGYVDVSPEEKEEILKIKKEMEEGEIYTYEEVFD